MDSFNEIYEKYLVEEAKSTTTAKGSKTALKPKAKAKPKATTPKVAKTVKTVKPKKPSTATVSKTKKPVESDYQKQMKQNSDVTDYYGLFIEELNNLFQSTSSDPAIKARKLFWAFILRDK